MIYVILYMTLTAVCQCFCFSSQWVSFKQLNFFMSQVENAA